MPDIPGPENFASESELASHIAEFLPERLRKTFCGEKPIETRPVTVINPLKPKKRSQNSTFGFVLTVRCQITN